MQDAEKEFNEGGLHNIVMPGHSRSKNSVASLAYVAGIQVLRKLGSKDVDGRVRTGHRVKTGHDEFAGSCQVRCLT